MVARAGRQLAIPSAAFPLARASGPLGSSAHRARLAAQASAWPPRPGTRPTTTEPGQRSSTALRRGSPAWVRPRPPSPRPPDAVARQGWLRTGSLVVEQAVRPMWLNLAPGRGRFATSRRRSRRPRSGFPRHRLQPGARSRLVCPAFPSLARCRAKTGVVIVGTQRYRHGGLLHGRRDVAGERRAWGESRSVSPASMPTLLPSIHDLGRRIAALYLK